LTNKDFIENIKFEFSSGHIIVKTKVGKQNNLSNFIFDTGAPTTVSPELSKELNLKKISVSLNKSENDPLKNSFPIVDSMVIGNIKFLNVGAAELEMSKIINTDCKFGNGIIGANLMKNCIWQINYSTQELFITDNLSKLQNLTNAIKINFTPAPSTGTPILNVLVNDTTHINLIIDTGFNGFISFSTMDNDKFLKSIAENNIRSVDSKGYSSVYGKDEATNLSYLIRSNMQINGHTFQNLPMAFGRYKNVSERKNGVIGNDFLKNFIVTIDWINNLIYLSPISEKPIHDNIITYGIKYGFTRNKLIIGGIWKNSEAEKNGIKIGDEIISFDGIETATLSQEQICTFNDTYEPTVKDKIIEIIILRNQQKLKFQLTSHFLF
jgi:predicted aspartyl protease